MYLPNYNKEKVGRKRVVKKNKLSEFETFIKNEPDLPDFTCPLIDTISDKLKKASDELEELRIMNSKLRENAEYWKESCEELQNKLNEIREWKQNLQQVVNQDI